MLTNALRQTTERLNTTAASMPNHTGLAKFLLEVALQIEEARATLLRYENALARIRCADYPAVETDAAGEWASQIADEALGYLKQETRTRR